VVTALAGAIGPDNLKAVLVAASKNEIAYVGATPAEKSPLAAPISAGALLDLIDERGMVPAGMKDLDQAQTLLSGYGLFDSAALSARSKARATYHAIEGAAGSWKLPLAIRNPMAAWDFGPATRAMSTAAAILALRDQAQQSFTGLELDGTVMQTGFEGAKTQADLDALLALAKNEAAAAATVAQANDLYNGKQGFVQVVGLIGSDPAASIAAAKDALARVKPDAASAAAQSAIDTIQGSTSQGTTRLAFLVALLFLAVTAALIVHSLRRRRKDAAVAVGFDAEAADAALEAALKPLPKFVPPGAGRPPTRPEP
jgi:hypothetical protein